MSRRQRDVVNSARDALRHEPVGIRIRAVLDEATVVDTTAAVLVWEPRRVRCEYAVPADALRAELTERRAEDTPAAPEDGLIGSKIPFAMHTAEGTAYDVHVGDRVLAGAAFRPADPDLAGLVLLDFHAFDAWYQEDEPNIGHPRDPFHRTDAYPSSRRVRVTADEVVVAESTRAVLMVEAMLPPRYYLPSEDVRVPLSPSETTTVCQYKGWASYWNADIDGTPLEDVAWSYLDPVSDCEQLRGLVCFDDAKVSVIAEDT